MTEKFYNVLWWSKNARQYRFGSPPIHGQAPGTNATSPHRDSKKRSYSIPRILSFHFENSFYACRHWFPESLEVFLWCHVGTWGLAVSGGCRACTGVHSYSTTTHCKIFLSLVSPFLICCNAPIFFSHFIFFSLLCCYRLRRWNCSWSTFRYILLLGL